MEVEITVRFLVKNLPSRKEIKTELLTTILDYIQWIAQEEGLFGIVEDGYTITSVRVVKE